MTKADQSDDSGCSHKHCVTFTVDNVPDELTDAYEDVLKPYIGTSMEAEAAREYSFCCRHMIATAKPVLEAFAAVKPSAILSIKPEAPCDGQMKVHLVFEKQEDMDTFVRVRDDMGAGAFLAPEGGN